MVEIVSSDTLKEPGVWYRVWIVGFFYRFIHVFTFVGCVCVYTQYSLLTL